MRLFLLLPLLVLGACADGDVAEATADSEAVEASATTLGEGVAAGAAITPATLIADAEAYDGQTVTVEGTAREVCQMAGCWLTLADDEGRTVRVEVPRDENEAYVYTFPDDVSGKTVRLTGPLAVETESVEDLRHYAEDGGASPEELAAITEPRQSLILTALGADIVDA